MISKKYILAGLYCLFCLPLIATFAEAGNKTFPAGSYVIPQDICWQPNKDTKTVEICNNTKDDDGDGVVDNPNTASNPYACYDLTGCDANQNDQGTFQATGMIYDILAAGKPVYWVINPSKTDRIAVDLTLAKSGTDPAVTIYHSTDKTDSGTLATVNYTGGPFVIDANDYDTTIQAIFDKYPNAKYHKANYDFSTSINKVLSGTPPKVAVLGEGSVQVLTDYLFASGLGNSLYDVFQYVSSADIINGKLSDFQLLWAPHWVIDSEISNAADRPLMLTKVRDFLEAGNAGFFECASIQSLERGYDIPNSKTSPSAYYAGQGILLDKTYSDVKGRVEQNGADVPPSGKPILVYEYPTEVLAQCGGWRFVPVTGLTEDIRPSQQPTPDYVYNSSVKRFIHDPDDMAKTGYAPKGYDYFLGGNINGSATQGYVAYLGGHQYVKCKTTSVATPTQRTFDFNFNASLASATTITVEAVYSGCTQGSTCPKTSFNITSSSGGYATDGTVFVDLDSALFGPDADPATKYVLSNIVIGNKSSTTDKTITGIFVSFDGNDSTKKLASIVDQSSPLTPVTVCSPNSPTPAACPEYTSKFFDFDFDTDLVSGTTVSLEMVYGTCTAGTNCPVGLAAIDGSVKTSGADTKISVDMSGASYDSANKKLTGVKITNLTAASQTLKAFNVAFPGNGVTKLTTIRDVTGASSTVCTANAASPAACPQGTATYNPVNYNFGFLNKIDNAVASTITVEINHTQCLSSGFAGTECPKVSYDVKTGAWAVDRIDSSGTTTVSLAGASLTQSKSSNCKVGSSKYYCFQDIQFTNLTSSDITVEGFRVTWTSANNTMKVVRSTYRGGNIWTGGTSGKTQDALNSPSPPWVGPELLPAYSTVPGSVSLILAGSSSPLSVTLGKAVSSCDVDWTRANTCGMKYVLNTLIGLQFQIIPNEYSKAGAIQQDNTLFKATYEYPGYKGHLYSIDVKKNPAVTNWDAGKSSTMPLPGVLNPIAPSSGGGARYIFTNKSGTTTKINFDVNSAGTGTSTDPDKLWYYLDPGKNKTLTTVKALIHAVRGRKNTSDADPSGDSDVSKRLGGIEHSSPAVMTKTRLAGSSTRDRVVFTGGDDAMLHAFHAGVWNSALNDGRGGYTAGTGKEIWAYIPTTLLGTLQNQTFTDCSSSATSSCPIFTVAAAVDGSPALGDYFVDHDQDNTTPKQWRTILVATALVSMPSATVASVKNQGIVFALDVTNPYDPLVLWERTYNAAVPPGSTQRNYYPSSAFTAAYIAGEGTSFKPNMGYAKGTAIGRVQVGTTLDTYVFVTSNWTEPVSGGYGINVYALDFYSGDIRWETKIAYTDAAAGINEAPPTPALMDVGNNGTLDYLVVGDSQGRLWVLKTIDGTTIDSSGAPAYDVGNATNEPIGAPAAIYENFIVFGTGGRDSLSDETTIHHVYAIQIDSKARVTNLWSFALLAGEKIWSAPVIDDAGTVYIGTSKGYTDTYSPDQLTDTSGRFIMLQLATGTLKTDSHGTPIAPLVLDSAVLGQIAVENGHVTLQLLNGKAIQIGTDDEASFTSAVEDDNPVRVLWWRKL